MPVPVPLPVPLPASTAKGREWRQAGEAPPFRASASPIRMGNGKRTAFDPNDPKQEPAPSAQTGVVSRRLR